MRTFLSLSHHLIGATLVITCSSSHALTFTANQGGAAGNQSVIHSGGLGDYTSLRAAADDFNSYPGGAQGQYTFYIASDLVEPENVAFGNQTNGHTVALKPQGAARTVTFTNIQPNAGQDGHIVIGARSLDFDTDQAKSDGFLIDGALPGNPKALTLQNTDAATSYTSSQRNIIVNVVGDTDYVTIRGCTVRNKVTVTGGFTYGINYTTVGDATVPAAPDYGQVQDCDIFALGKIGHGVSGHFWGGMLGQKDLRVTSCTIRTTCRGVLLNQNAGGVIEDNVIRVDTRPATGVNAHGILLTNSAAYGPWHLKIQRNQVTVISSTTTYADLVGIVSAISAPVDASTKIDVINNMVTLQTVGASPTPRTVRGIAMWPNFGEANILYNSVLLAVETPDAQPYLAGTNGGIATLSTLGITQFHVRNNVVRSDMKYVAPFYARRVGDTTSDGNVWSVIEGGRLVDSTFGWYTNLADWQTSSGEDMLSQEYDPRDDWVSTTNLHLKHDPAHMLPAIIEDVTTSVVDDLDLELRDSIAPNRGADEFVPPPPPPPDGPDLQASWDGTTVVCRGTERVRCWVRLVLSLQNSGTQQASPCTVRVVLSDDDVPDSSDRVIARVSTRPLVAGETRIVRRSLRLPRDVSGKYLIATADYAGELAEIDETNNDAVYGPVP